MNNVQAPNSRRAAPSAGPVSRAAPQADPRANQREKLIAAAKTAIDTQGLGGLRARDLAAEIGCSVGGIYNLVADLDELVLRVGQGTMADLNACLNEAARGVIERDAAIRGVAVRHLAALGQEARGLKPDEAPTPAADPTEDDPASLFVAWALAYAAFAEANRERWRALFDFRLAQGKDLPDWFEADQTQLFVRLEERLASLLPGLDAVAVRKRARTLFSAVHGIVTLGLEGKLVAWPAAPIEAELEAFIRIYVAGLMAGAAGR